MGRRVLLTAGPAAAVLVLGVGTADGLTRPGYDLGRHWVSQLTLGPCGWLGTVTLVGTGVMLAAYALGLRRWPRAHRLARLVRVCAAGFLFLALVPIDPGLDFPPGMPAVHTPRGFLHQAGAMVLFVAGTAAARETGRLVGGRAGWLVVGVMTVAFVAACVLVTLDVLGVLSPTPSGLLERVALGAGLVWVGSAGWRLHRCG